MVESVITVQGQNDVRDFLIDQIDEVAVGTGTSSPTETDTSLDSEVFRGTASNEAVSNGELESTIRLGTGDSNGNDITELMLYRDGESVARLVFGDTPKTSGNEIEFETRINTENK